MICDVKSKLILNALPYLGKSADWNPHAKQLGLGDFFIFILFYLYIYPPDSQESDGGANT